MLIKISTGRLRPNLRVLAPRLRQRGKAANQHRGQPTVAHRPEVDADGDVLITATYRENRPPVFAVVDPFVCASGLSRVGLASAAFIFLQRFNLMRVRDS